MPQRRAMSGQAGPSKVMPRWHMLVSNSEPVDAVPCMHAASFHRQSMLLKNRKRKKKGGGGIGKGNSCLPKKKRTP